MDESAFPKSLAGREAYERFSVIDALRRSEERLSPVLEAANLGLWDWDLPSDHLIWSERCLALFGLPRDTQEPRKNDLREIVESVLVLFSARLANASIRIEREFEGSAVVICYRDELAQVVSNIVGNAYNAMRCGGRLRIRIKPMRDSNGHPGFRMTIADNGSGIPSKVRRSLFEPLAMSGELAGTGWGMWAAKEIVHRHGGRISLRSSQAAGFAGTTIGIFLPLNGPQTEG